MAAKAALAFNPDLKINSFHDNIKSPRFNVNYFQQFDLVLNALDNVDARRHVNRLCLAASVPLIDSGTTGYLGQVTPIIKGITACYECYPKPTQKVYPICTIRSTPDKPVHCIVWAKECFKLLFGPVTESMLFEDEAATGEKSAYMHLLSPLPPGNDGSLTLDSFVVYAEQLVKGLFREETQKRIDMEVYKTAKITPEPLSLEAIAGGIQKFREDYASLSVDAPVTKQSSLLARVDWDHQVWSPEESVYEFVVCLLEAMWQSQQRAEIGHLGFDKDDLWAMRFVTAASNLRSHIFHIPLLSFHNAKGIAGNIIPAIATTNAIIAAVQTNAAVRLLLELPKAVLFAPDATQPERKKELQGLIRRLAPHTYCLRIPTRRGHLLEPSDADDPQSSCYVCHTAQQTLQIDTKKTTLETLLTKVIKGRLGFNEPNILTDATILYEEGDDCDEDLKDNLPLLLVDCPAGGIRDQTLLTIEDFSQKLEVKLLVQHVEEEELAKEESTAVDLFRLGGQPIVQQNSEGTAAIAAENKPAGQESAVEEDDIVLIESIEGEKIGKRAIDQPSSLDEPSSKRKRVDEE